MGREAATATIDVERGILLGQVLTREEHIPHSSLGRIGHFNRAYLADGIGDALVVVNLVVAGVVIGVQILVLRGLVEIPQLVAHGAGVDRRQRHLARLRHAVVVGIG